MAITILCDDAGNQYPPAVEFDVKRRSHGISGYSFGMAFSGISITMCRLCSRNCQFQVTSTWTVLSHSTRGSRLIGMMNSDNGFLSSPNRTSHSRLTSRAQSTPTSSPTVSSKAHGCTIRKLGRQSGHHFGVTMLGFTSVISRTIQSGGIGS